MFSFDNREILFKGVKIGYRVEGNGNKVLLLLHGLQGHSGTWRNNIFYLSKKAKVIAPSLFYQRNKNYEELSNEYMLIIDEILKQEGYEEVCIIGNSFGGYVAIKFYCKNKMKVKCLVLEDSFIPYEDNNFEKCLGDISIPVLIIWGEKDDLIPLDAAYYIKSRIKSSNLVIMENVSHVPHWENPNLFNEIVAKFLEDNRFF